VTTYLFVGERPSHKAVAIGATWQNAQLAGRTLRDALLAAGVDPEAQRYVNLWRRPDRGNRFDEYDLIYALRQVRRAVAAGCVVVGMGRLVCRELSSCRVPHTRMVHPAARGSIRRRCRYHRHVKATLARAAREQAQAVPRTTTPAHERELSAAAV